LFIDEAAQRGFVPAVVAVRPETVDDDVSVLFYGRNGNENRKKLLIKWKIL